MKIENVGDFVKTLNREQREFFLEYRNQTIQRKKKCLTVVDWDESARELSEMEERKRGEQGIFGWHFL